MPPPPPRPSAALLHARVRPSTSARRSTAGPRGSTVTAIQPCQMIACAGIVPSFCGVALEDLSCLGLERKLFPRCRCVLVLRGKKGRAAYFFTLVSSSVRFSQAPSTNSSQETLTSRLISPRFVGSASMGRHALSLGALFCCILVGRALAKAPTPGKLAPGTTVAVTAYKAVKFTVSAAM